MLQAVRLLLACLSLFLFLVELDACLALFAFLAFLGTFHYLLWGRAMELECDADFVQSSPETDDQVVAFEEYTTNQ